MPTPVLLAVLIVVLIGLCFLLVRTYQTSEPAVERETERVPTTSVRSEHLNAPVHDPDLRVTPARENGSSARVISGDGFHARVDTCPSSGMPRYRARPSVAAGGPQWNPYDAKQSRVARVQAARRKPRPPKGIHVTADDSPGARSLDHYAMLGVRRDATRQELEAAYRRYAASIHPDKFFADPVLRAQAEERLKDLNRIMQIMRDPARRARYDASL